MKTLAYSPPRILVVYYSGKSKSFGVSQIRVPSPIPVFSSSVILDKVISARASVSLTAE